MTPPPPSSILDARAQAAALAAPRLGARLGGDALATLVTAAGTGVTTSNGFALTRWSADPVEDREGTLLYLKDEGSGALWSVGVEPIAPRAGRAAAAWRPGVFTLRREEHGIAATLEIAVVPGRA
ncbi:MAG: hypothetical protein ABI960_06670, partial [Candidatus Eisenbacteria bacterium]